MKKTIAFLALSASSAGFARFAPPEEVKTICLSVYENGSGILRAGNCDNSRNNLTSGTPLLENGCAEGQISLVSQKRNGQFDINVVSCLPPNVAQL